MKFCPTCLTKYPDDANFCPQESCATADGPSRLQAAPEEARARFQPTVRLGGSTTGEVWKARDSETGGEVAYKIVAADVLPTPAAQARAEREFKQLMRVQSAKIAGVIDCGKTPDQRLYVAMQLCQGESLDRMLRNGPLPFDRAKAIVAQVGQALLEAQKAGIVHRDVSPKNVLVSTTGDVHMINFPLAKPLTDKVSGVAAYVSPEQAQGRPVDQRSNTYSLACIFYHLLTGEPPFQAASPQAVLDLHISSPPLPPSQRRPEATVSPEVDRVILKALDKNSSRRHLTLRLFLTEIESLSVPAVADGAAAATGGGAGGGKEVGFAKTMLFAGGQKEVANLVARAIAARTAGATPAGGVGQPAAAGTAAASGLPAAAPAAAPLTSTVSGTLVMGSTPQEPVQVAPAVSRLTPAPVTPLPSGGREAVGAATLVVGAAPAGQVGAGTGQAGASAGQAALAAAKQSAEAYRVKNAEAAAKPPAETGTKPAFRETLWFKKGDVDQMVAEAKAKMAAAGRHTPGEGLPEDVRPIEDRYVDDGSVTTDDRKQFSLRTGGTATSLPAVSPRVPGEGMSDEDVIDEIAGTKRTLIIVISAVVLAAVVAVLVMMMRGKGERRADGIPVPSTRTELVSPQSAPPSSAPAAVAVEPVQAAQAAPTTDSPRQIATAVVKRPPESAGARETPAKKRASRKKAATPSKRRH